MHQSNKKWLLKNTIESIYIAILAALAMDWFALPEPKIFGEIALLAIFTMYAVMAFLGIFAFFLYSLRHVILWITDQLEK